MVQMPKESNKIFHKFLAMAPTITFFCAILFLYATYMITYLLKLLTREYDYNKNEALTEEYLDRQEQKGKTYFIIIHALLLLTLIGIFRGMFSSPGRIPPEWSREVESSLNNAVKEEEKILIEEEKKKKKGIINTGEEAEENMPLNQENNDDEELSPQEMENLHEIAYMNVVKRENLNVCSHCQLFKPPRTHHCTYCDACTLKMDSHCGAVDNCIGHKNLKFYFIMFFYGVILFWFTIITYTEAFKDTLFNENVNSMLVFWIAVTYIPSALICLFTTLTFIFHAGRTIKGRTLIEQLEPGKLRNYNYGFWPNIKLALGSDVWMWLLPTSPRLDESGLDFKEISKAKVE